MVSISFKIKYMCKFPGLVLNPEVVMSLSQAMVCTLVTMFSLLLM